MSHYVALLRGINVGGRRVPMADLKACFEALGFTGVSTLLQSGNVLFDADATSTPALRNRIETAVGARFHYPAHILIYTVTDIERAIRAYPFDAANAERQHYIIFIQPELVAGLAADPDTLDPAIERVAPGNGVVYWSVQKGLTLKSAFAQRLTKAAYKEHHTNRNLNTLRKLVAR